MTMTALRRRAEARRIEKEASQRLRALEGSALHVIEKASTIVAWAWRDDLRKHLRGLKPDALAILARDAKDDRVREAAVRLRDTDR